MVIQTIIPIGAAAAALVYAGLLAIWVTRQPAGNEKILEISRAVRAGATAFLRREFLTLAPLTIVLAIIIALVVNWQTALGVVAGASLSALAGYVAMNITVKTAPRSAAAVATEMGIELLTTTQNSGKGDPARALGSSLTTAFRGGSVVGMIIVGLALLGVTTLYVIFQNPLFVAGLGLGASLVALLIRVAGGIYTKAADLGADLVGKIEAGIPEDDPRNPAVIADNVGDNVGDAAGMGSDVFESYIVTAIASMLLGSLIMQQPHIQIFPPPVTATTAMITYPLLIGAAGIVGSVVAALTITSRPIDDAMKPLNLGFAVAAAVTIVMNFLFTYFIFGTTALGISLFVSTILGTVTVVAIERITDYYTNYKYKPVQETAEATNIGHSANILTGLIAGLRSTLPSALTIVLAIIISYALSFSVTQSHLMGIYATAITTMAMLSLTGIIMSIDSFGPITDNAGGIVEMTGMPEEVREITDKLDAVGNTTKATTKGFAIASAALAALALIQAFQNEATSFFNRQFTYEISSAPVIIGLLIGGLLPFYYSSFLIAAVSKTATIIVEEVRRQFREIGGIMEGTAKPDYARCIDIATKESLKRLLQPGAIGIAAPIIIGILLGPKGVAGLLTGAVITAVYLAYTMANSGAAWDNAKKYLEVTGRKKTEQHKIAVAGDLVGDPLKDTSSVSLNPLIKLLNTVSIVFMPLLVGLLSF